MSDEDNERMAQAKAWMERINALPNVPDWTKGDWKQVDTTLEEWDAWMSASPLNRQAFARLLMKDEPSSNHGEKA